VLIAEFQERENLQECELPCLQPLLKGRPATESKVRSQQIRWWQCGGRGETPNKCLEQQKECPQEGCHSSYIEIIEEDR
jgi:hypothetical protein